MQSNALTGMIAVERVLDDTAVGTTTINSAGVDLSSQVTGDPAAGRGGFASCLFIVQHGTVTNAGTIKVQASDDDGSGDSYGDLAGTEVAIAAGDDDKCTMIEIVNPQKRWLRVLVVRGSGTGQVIDGGLAILSQTDNLPTTQPAGSIGASEVHHSPDEGTA